MSKICYYGDRISPNIAQTPEGFLICRNVPIARTGYQEYLESELVEDGDPNEYVSVFRSPDEVFSRATLASFEGKPVTNGHPDVDVSTRNYSRLSKGHVQHVRMGSGKDSDKIIADLYITDPDLIEEIRNGKRQVSAGYYAMDVRDKLGRVCQTRIRGNHVAVVNEGRAGSSVCIRDSKSGGIMKKTDRKKAIAGLVIRYLRDAEPEELADRMKDAAEVLNEEIAADEEPVVEEQEIVADKCGKKDGDDDVWDAIHSIDARLEALESKMNSREDEEPKADEDISEEADLELSDEDIDGDGMDDDDDMDEADLADSDDEDMEDAVPAKDSALQRISRAALGIKDARDRKRVQDAILSVCGKSQMAGLMKTVAKNKAKRDAAAKDIDVEAMQAIYDKLNPHKGGK